MKKLSITFGIALLILSGCDSNYNYNQKRADTMGVITQYYMNQVKYGPIQNQLRMVDSANKYNNLTIHYLLQK